MSHPHATFSSATRIVPAEGSCSDVVRVVKHPYSDALFVVVADGSGNSARGLRAATVFADEALRSLVPDSDFIALLSRLDQAVAQTGGETTGIALVVTGGIVRGASVGDSEAWLVGESTQRLTEGQRRKPLLGSGSVEPVLFRAPFTGTLVAATDGLFKYAKLSAIINAAKLADLQTAADALVNAARMPNGGLQDDVGLALLRR